MADVKFYLKDRNKTSTSIYAVLRFKYFETDNTGKKKYKMLKVKTGESINPEYWDSKEMKVSKKYTGYPEFNKRLSDIETIINDTLRRMLNDGRGDEINPESLRSEVIEQIHIAKKTIMPVKKGNGFGDFIQTIITETENGKRTHTKTGKRLQKVTVNSYKVTLKHIRDYECKNHCVLRFKDITTDFHQKFIKYMNDEDKAVNTIGCNIKNIKLFMKIAHVRKLTENTDYLKEGFNKVSEETYNIYLTENELLKIYQTDLSKDKRLEAVRDIFLIGCYTGLRFSDLVKLRAEHINEKNITITTQKTGNRIVIPLHWIVTEILEKYNHQLPRVISNQKMNEYIKLVGEKAEINDIIIIKETKDGKNYDKDYEKNKLITVHTARRSFATNMYLKDIPTISIMKITGHKTEKAFLEYIKVTSEQNAKKLQSHPFFTRKMVIGG